MGKICSQEKGDLWGLHMGRTVMRILRGISLLRGDMPRDDTQSARPY